MPDSDYPRARRPATSEQWNANTSQLSAPDWPTSPDEPGPSEPDYGWSTLSQPEPDDGWPAAGSMPGPDYGWSPSAGSPPEPDHGWSVSRSRHGRLPEQDHGWSPPPQHTAPPSRHGSPSSQPEPSSRQGALPSRHGWSPSAASPSAASPSGLGRGGPAAPAPASEPAHGRPVRPQTEGWSPPRAPAGHQAPDADPNLPRGAWRGEDPNLPRSAQNGEDPNVPRARRGEDPNVPRAWRGEDPNVPRARHGEDPNVPRTDGRPGGDPLPPRADGWPGRGPASPVVNAPLGGEPGFGRAGAAFPRAGTAFPRGGPAPSQAAQAPPMTQAPPVTQVPPTMKAPPVTPAPPAEPPSAAGATAVTQALPVVKAPPTQAPPSNQVPPGQAPSNQAQASGHRQGQPLNHLPGRPLGDVQPLPGAQPLNQPTDPGPAAPATQAAVGTGVPAALKPAADNGLRPPANQAALATSTTEAANLAAPKDLAGAGPGGTQSAPGEMSLTGPIPAIQAALAADPMPRSRQRALARARARQRNRRMLVFGALLVAVLLIGLDLMNGGHIPGTSPSVHAVAGGTGASAQPAAPTSSVAVTEKGSGSFTYATGTGPVIGAAGTLRKYRVAVENGSGQNVTAFAAIAQQTLADPRGWTKGRDVRFQQVEQKAPAEFTLYLATPATSEKMCASGGIHTDEIISCRIPGQVIINLARWLNAMPGFGASIATYQQFTLNHEIGRELGHSDEGCPAAGALAPVMQEQTLGLKGCKPNAWPYINGVRYSGPAMP